MALEYKGGGAARWHPTLSSLLHFPSLVVRSRRPLSFLPCKQLVCLCCSFCSKYTASLSPRSTLHSLAPLVVHLVHIIVQDGQTRIRFHTRCCRPGCCRAHPSVQARRIRAPGVRTPACAFPRTRSDSFCSYAAFQISDGTAGNAQAEANAVFVDPFNGVDLATVDATTLKAVQTMREAAEDAETSQFNPAIEAASGAAATALQNGKIKNKVLKLTGEVQGINIQIAQAKAAGKDTTKLTASLAAEQ